MSSDANEDAPDEDCNLSSLEVENEINMECELTREMDSVTSNRVLKRNRGQEPDVEGEEWMEVGRGGKKLALNRGEGLTSKGKIEVAMTSTEKLPKQFGLARLLKEENIPDIVSVKYINLNKAIISFDKAESAAILVSNKNISEKGLRCYCTQEINKTFGVIKDVDLEMSEKEILSSLKCDQTIMSVKRLNRRNTMSGAWEPSESVRLCFDCPSLPEYVYTSDIRIKVVPYKFPVTQCSRCWRFGHSMRICPSLKAVCPKCTGNHENCETTSFKCVNCSGNHMALSRLCPSFIKEKKVREMMSELNCTYNKAVATYNSTIPMTSIDTQKDSSFPPLSQVSLTPSMNHLEDHTYASCLKSPSSSMARTAAEPRRTSSVAPRQPALASPPAPAPASLTLATSTPAPPLPTPTLTPCVNVSKHQNYGVHSQEKRNDEERNNGPSNSQMKDSFCNLVDELMKIFCENSSTKEKFSCCAKIIWEWILGVVGKYVRELPFFNLFMHNA